MFMFDESPQTLLSRSAALNIDLSGAVDAGLVTIRQVDPAELTPGEFIHAIRESVENGARIVVIDSLNGYLNAMPEERFLIIQLHELLMYLGQRGVATILISAHQGLDRHRRCRRRSMPATWPTPSSCSATSKSEARCARRCR